MQHLNFNCRNYAICETLYFSFFIINIRENEMEHRIGYAMCSSTLQNDTKPINVWNKLSQIIHLYRYYAWRQKHSEISISAVYNCFLND